MAEYHTFEGEFSLAKVYEPEVAFNKLQWTVIFQPKDDIELGKIMSTGLGLTPKKDEYSGKSRVTFRRPVTREFGDEVVQFNPPMINGAVTSRFVDKETKKSIFSYEKGKVPKNMAYIGDPVPIPNGSKGKVTISVYKTGQGKGHRLESLYVTELAEEKQYTAVEHEMSDEIPDFAQFSEPSNKKSKENEEKAPW